MMGHTSILDLKSREVDLKIWLYYSPIILFIIYDIKHVYLPLYLYSLTTSELLLGLLYKFSMIGGADVFASLLLSLANAYIVPLFSSKLARLGMEPLLILLYTSLLILFYGFYNFVRNIPYVKGYTFSQKLKLAFVGKRVKVRDFLNSRFLFPLTKIKEDGTVELRFNFDIEEDDKMWREYFRKLVEKGLIDENSTIWVTWGIPVLPFMLMGYILSLLIGFPFI